MKTIDALKIGGIVFAGVAAVMVISKIAKTGATVAEAAKKVITEDLNPASGKNVVTQTLQSTSSGMKIHETIGNFLGRIFDPEGYRRYMDNLKTLENHGQVQKGDILPPTGAGGGQSSPAFAAIDPRRLDRTPARTNPLAGVETLGWDNPAEFGLNLGSFSYKGE